jgi:hypothetical protein
MTRYDDGTNSSAKTRKQQEDHRRMAFRRAIESYSDERRLHQEIADYPDLMLWQAPAAGARQSVQPAR